MDKFKESSSRPYTIKKSFLLQENINISEFPWYYEDWHGKNGWQSGGYLQHSKLSGKLRFFD